MGYSQDKYDLFFPRMEMFQRIAKTNRLSLKDFLMKKVGADTELADALIEKFEKSEDEQSIASPKQNQLQTEKVIIENPPSQDKFDSYYSKKEIFQKIAHDNGLSLKEALLKRKDVDEELAEALINKWEKSGDEQSPAKQKINQTPTQNQNIITLRTSEPNTSSNFNFLDFIRTVSKCLTSPIKKWGGIAEENNKTNSNASPPAPKSLEDEIEFHLPEMQSYARMAQSNELSVKEWLIKNRNIDAELAVKLIDAWIWRGSGCSGSKESATKV